MSETRYWEGVNSLAGSLQAMDETLALQRMRADLAEKRLRHLRRSCEWRTRCGITTMEVWRIIDILDGAADGED